MSSTLPARGIASKQIGDLLHTILAHCSIGKILLEENYDYLVPTILEDIYTYAQELTDYIVEKG